MNYRHIYHAGNFADVVKHIILIALINNLKQKEKPFAVLDAFAGIGLYDLKDERPNRTGEYNRGIGLLHAIEQKVDLPKLIQQYLGIISGCNDIRHCESPAMTKQSHESWDCLVSSAPCNDTNLEVSNLYYPGSPMIISSLLRAGDRLIASELHKEDYLELKHNMHSYNAQIHNMDAYNAIKAFVPPKEKRGLVFIDPAFEVRDEFSKLITSLKHIKTSFLTGQVMIWFPIKDIAAVNQFYKQYKEIGYKESLLLEFEVSKIAMIWVAIK